MFERNFEHKRYKTKELEEFLIARECLSNGCLEARSKKKVTCGLKVYVTLKYISTSVRKFKGNTVNITLKCKFIRSMLVEEVGFK